MNTTARQRTQTAGEKPKNITSCNFRSANRITNEDARTLTSVHDNFARNLTTALDAYLGTGLDVQLSGIDQLRSEDHIAAATALSCIVPFSMRPAPGAILLACDIEIVFLMIDLLMGGDGSSPIDGPRELSEIEDEIVLDVFSLIARQAETAWRMPGGTLAAGARVKPTALDEYCPQNDKLTCLKFTFAIGEHTGSFQLVLTSSLLAVILQQIKPDKPQKRATVRYFPRQGIRERLLDTDVTVGVELPGLKIAVKDLLALLPGSVLKLRAPVRTPGVLIAGGRGIFEATPVRNGSRKAAQLGRRIAPEEYLERM